MRNIINDLEERLSDNRARTAQLRKIFESDLAELDDNADTIARMIEMEINKQDAKGTSLPRARMAPRNITDFIILKLSDGKVWKTETLRDEALHAGLLKDSASPGRSAHGSLLGLMKAGKVKKVGKSTWKAIEDATLL